MARYTVGADQNDPILHGVDEFIVQKNTPLRLEQFTSAMREEVVCRYLPPVTVLEVVLERIGELDGLISVPGSTVGTHRDSHLDKIGDLPS